MADAQKNRQATKERIKSCLFDNGVTLTPHELDVVFSHVSKGQPSINYLDFISACRGQMSAEREAAVDRIFKRIGNQKTDEISIDSLMSRFKAERHPDVKVLGKEPQRVKATISDNLDLFGRLGGYDLQHKVMKYDEFLEFFDGMSSLETDDRKFLTLANECFA
jgi:Ca2+-binding EF-hand superfamily protein